jgi:nucleoside-diphosphate-sugar epimerase
MQTILGAGGAIGVELAKALKQYTSEIRLVSRHPKKVNETDQLFPADLSNPDQVEAAIKGSEIVYVTIGLEYKTSTWQQQWPPLMRSIVDACIKHQSKLVFFDNVYMIGGDNVKHITEHSPISPVSKKGEVRAQIDRMILDAIAAGKLQAIIARSADFYGLVKDKSILMELVYKNLEKGKKAQWFCNAHVKHSFTYTPDAGKATALLGNTPDAYNQVWNLPTDRPALTGQEWVELFAAEMGAKQTKIQVVSKGMLRFIGIFVPIMREFPEMVYQYDREYFFDSSKFEQRFGIKPTAYREGVKETVAALKNVASSKKH